MRSAMSVLLEETAFGGHASLQPADPSIGDFLEHLTAACPIPVIHAGQKCPQFCGIGRSWMLNKLYFELVPQKRSLAREVWRARRLKFDCAVQHCLVVFTSQPGSVRRCVVQDQSKNTPRLHEGCAIGHEVLVHHLDPLLSIEFHARLHEVQRGRNVAGAHDARAITPRVVAVCDAINRSGVSSSSSASMERWW